MWIFCINPDNNSIPILTAMGDLLGSTFLAAAFYVHSYLGGGVITTSTVLYASSHRSINASAIIGNLTAMALTTDSYYSTTTGV